MKMYEKLMTDIPIHQLLLGLLLLIIPFSIFFYYRIGLSKSTVISFVRMWIQLGLVALYLEWIFDLNSSWLNSLWVLIMIAVGSFTIINKVGLRWKYFILPFFFSGLTAIIIVDSFFLGYILKLNNFFDAQYFIPITGMILGNSMNFNIVGMNTYFKALDEKKELYYFLRTNGNQSKMAIRPFIVEGMRQGLTPLLANISVIGLISLPGMMTGQILGGSSPVVAIKYQLMIMTAIFVGCTINISLSILISNKIIFDKWGRLKAEVKRPHRD